MTKDYDCIVIGGGIFGLYAASIMSSKNAKVALLEKETSVFNRASKVNQSRVHRGYHYPRSFETALKTSNYYHRFCNDFNFALLKPFRQYYAISNDNSKVTAKDYIKFCKKLNIPYKEVNSSIFFQRNKVSAMFEVDEACFNYLKIKDYFLEKFKNNRNVDIFYGTFPISSEISDSNYILEINSSPKELIAPIIINTTYKNVNEINRMFGFPEYKVKYELCELELCEVDEILTNNGLTILDGPFFSFMPFADGKISTLSSVHHTPIDTSYIGPQNEKCNLLNRSEIKSDSYSPWADMKSLAKSYLKQNLFFEYKTSIFEIKPIMISSEEDDSRPTFVKSNSTKPLFISVLAGKINTIYDLEKALIDL